MLLSALTAGMLLFFATAQAETPDAEALSNIPPISTHYTRKIIERVQRGLAHAESAQDTQDPSLFRIFFGSWLDQTSAAMLSLVDTDLRIEAQHRDLTEATACLHLDILILESWTERVRVKLHEAFAQRNIISMLRLMSLIRFLNQRIAHLVRGARDPLYEDTSWGTMYLFDPPGQVWCCLDGKLGNACKPMAEEECARKGTPFLTPRACQEFGCLLPEDVDPTEGRMCPFHSDYLPPVESGYGCDTDAMPEEAAAVHAPTRSEREALLELLKVRDDLRKEIRGTTTRADDEREHRTVSGCLEDIPEWKAFGTGDTLFSHLRLAAYERRGPFSLEADEPAIALRFLRWIRRWGEIRPQADELKYPSEFPPGREREEATEREEEMGPLERILRWMLRIYYRVWSIRRTPEEALPLLEAHDLMLTLEKEAGAGQLRSATDRLVTLAHNLNGGMRGFTRNHAYFIRRTCVFRPCNKRLEQILRIVFQDICFPYADGRYKGGADVHTQCKNAAEIDVSP